MCKRMKMVLAGFLAVLALTAEAWAWEDGVYQDQAEGYGGNVIVTVQVREGKIVSLTTENTGGEKSEYYLKAEEALSEEIVEKNGLDGVDAVSGSTGTSESILAAVKGILEQASYTGDGQDNRPGAMPDLTPGTSPEPVPSASPDLTPTV